VTAASVGSRVVVITGGGGGICSEVAHLFAEDGDTVAILDSSMDKAKVAASAIEVAAGSAYPYEVDVSDESSVRQVVASISEDLGHIDVLVNGAAIIRRQDPDEMSSAAWKEVIDVNLTGTFLMCRATVPTMAPGSSIVNIGSINAMRHNPSIIAYGVSKAGVAALTQALAVALAPRGIRVNGVIGGHVLTDFSRARLGNPAVRSKIEASIPLARLGDPGDFATVIRFLAGPESGWVTGAMVPVDGGWLAADTTALIPNE
jgi:NAD(P)-dependent dehydrogenase (short-subunit alcohol dehydrogenase family)